MNPHRKVRAYRSRLGAGIAVALLLTSLSLGAQERTSLVLGTIGESAEARIAERVLSEAYRRIGVTVTFERYTGDIGIERANSGRLDGEAQRVNGTERIWSDLVQVPVPLAYLDVAAFTTDSTLTVRGPGDLRLSRVGIVRGTMAAELSTRDLEIRRVDTYPELFSLFATGVLDVILVPTMNPLAVQRDVPALRTSRLVAILDNYLVYHYLHRDRVDMLPRIEPVLKRMLLDGSIARIREEQSPPLKRGAP